MKWFKAQSYYTPKIEEVDVVKETPKMITIRYPREGGYYERRVAKHSTRENYFNTWEEAQDHILDIAKARVGGKFAALRDAKAALAHVESWVKP